MLTRHPDMVPLDDRGRPRGFGSRRHYCFSHEGYLEECRRIVTLLARLYGRNRHLRKRGPVSRRQHGWTPEIIPNCA